MFGETLSRWTPTRTTTNWPLIILGLPPLFLETAYADYCSTMAPFFFCGVTATAPSRDLTDNKKKEEGGLKQRRKQEEAAQGDPEPGKGNQEKEKDPSRVQS